MSDVTQKKTLRLEVQERMAGYLTAAFGLIAGLAWNDAIRGLITYIYPDPGESVLAKFVYAAVLTVLLVFVSILLVRLHMKKGE